MKSKEWTEEDLQDKYLEEQGWKRKYGLIIQTEMIDDEFPEWFFPEEMENEFLSRGFRWQHTDHTEVAEDCDVLEMAQDIASVNFEEWKEQFAKHENDGEKKNG